MMKDNIVTGSITHPLETIASPHSHNIIHSLKQSNPITSPRNQQAIVKVTPRGDHSDHVKELAREHKDAMKCNRGPKNELVGLLFHENSSEFSKHSKTTDELLSEPADDEAEFSGDDQLQRKQMKTPRERNYLDISGEQIDIEKNSPPKNLLLREKQNEIRSSTELGKRREPLVVGSVYGDDGSGGIWKPTRNNKRGIGLFTLTFGLARKPEPPKRPRGKLRDLSSYARHVRYFIATKG
ncbi:hypothetical protein Pcinc_012095 [Petrolisthes cinctipes]|uniref:Uncharacterized protein n=1 Tax=Petrolisthes cinctipes TaxID=88211 RepID=A0AAE1G2E3_PETCI|nr:hypothetical protein Pcinc_012095 [Petrolisthes cinctipes]